MKKCQRFETIIDKLKRLPPFDSVELAYANIQHVFRETEKDVMPIKNRMQVQLLERMNMIKVGNKSYWFHCYRAHVLILDNDGGFEIRETNHLNFLLTEDFIFRNFFYTKKLPVIIKKKSRSLN